jgi:hypothetical protein
MARCKICDGYLIYEPEFMETPARFKCMACGWMVSDPNFRKEQPRYFPADRTDKLIDWQQQNSGYDLYSARSAAAQLGISESFFRYSVKTDATAPVILGRGMNCLQYACVTAVVGWEESSQIRLADWAPSYAPPKGMVGA